MLLRVLRKTALPALRMIPKYAMNHIKNMHEEALKKDIEEIFNQSLIEKTDRVYKPTYTIEFDRTGEVLLYSADPLSHETIYFKYPYVMYECCFILGVLNFALDPFSLHWTWANYGLWGGVWCAVPRIWFYHDFKFTPNKISLLRGGRVLKVQSQTISNVQFTYWIETRMAKPLEADNMHFADKDHADFLDETGQLKFDLNVEFEEFKLESVNTNNQTLYLKKHGTIHHPELFEAAIKGFNIDTTDFVINTADNIRHREGNFDQ